MSYINTRMLEEFSGKYSEEDSTMPQLYVNAAVETIARYLHYNPEAVDRTIELYGDGTDCLVLPAPIIEISSVSINGNPEDLSGWTWKKNYLFNRQPDGAYRTFNQDDHVEIRFRGGFDPVPLKIVTTALQLASLYQESAGGNLAVSSTSFADQGTRVFNNFHEDRFLTQINEWRIYNV